MPCQTVDRAMMPVECSCHTVCGVFSLAITCQQSTAFTTHQELGCTCRCIVRKAYATLQDFTLVTHLNLPIHGSASSITEHPSLPGHMQAADDCICAKRGHIHSQTARILKHKALGYVSVIKIIQHARIAPTGKPFHVPVHQGAIGHQAAHQTRVQRDRA